MKRLIAFLPLVGLMPLHASGVSIQPSQLIPRDGTEDLLYEDLLSDGMCHLYLPDPENETHDMYTPRNDRLQMHVCNEWCEENHDKPGGLCSGSRLDEMWDGKISEVCGGLNQLTRQCVDEATDTSSQVIPDMVPYRGGETRGWFVYSFCDCSVSDVVEGVMEHMVLPALVALGQFLCDAVNTFIDIAIEIATAAISFVPGGQAVAGVARAVRAAKTIAENGLEAGAFFNDYLGSGSGCEGNPADFRMPDNPEEVFDTLVNAPDSLNGEDMTSLGCKRGRGDCRSLDRQPDVDLPVSNDGNNNDNDNDNTRTRDDESSTEAESSTTTRDEEASTTTEADSSTTTDSDDDASTTTDAESSRTTTTEATSTTDDSESPSSTRTDCARNARRTGDAGEDDSCEIERPECSGNNTPLCDANDCRGNKQTERCTAGGLNGCKCLLVGEGGVDNPYTESMLDEQWGILEQAGIE